MKTNNRNAVIGIYLFLRGEAIITAEAGVRRLASVYGSPNNVGLFLGRCIPFALAYMLTFADKYRQIAAALALGVMLLAVALTQSVGALLFSVPVGIAVVLLLSWRWKAVPVLAGLAVIGLVTVVGLSQVSTRFSNLLDLSDGTNFIRLRIWESSLDIILDYPITGLGLDQFLYAFSGHYIRPDAIFDPDLSHPHNIVFDFWIRLGFAGAVLLVMMQVIYWRKMWKAYNESNDKVWRVLVVGAMGSMAALVVHGLIDNSVFVDDLVYVFMLLLAIAAHTIHDYSVVDSDRSF